MARPASDNHDFERLIADLLRANDFEVQEQRLDQRGFDFRITSRSGEALVEVKAYRTLRIGHNIVRRSFQLLHDAMEANGVKIGIFATNAQLPGALRQEARSLGIVVYDFDVLQLLTSGHPRLAERLARTFQDMFIYRSEPLPPVDGTREIDLVSGPPSAPPPIDATIPPQPDRNRGDELCKALKATKAGRVGKAAALFEAACIEALRYLFEDDFIGWDAQTRSHSALHRYDLIARINSQNDFWNLMITDHRARYIIFEFKNYPKKISQVQIYSTEKYLLPVAMRSTAIIISRTGFDNNAFRVSAGALRNEGKLILGLNIDEVCEMLHTKDNGGDPAKIIGGKLDDMLIGLER